MAGRKDFPLTLTIRAVDNATANLRKVNAQIGAITAPARKLNNSFAALSREAGLPRLAKSFRGVGGGIVKVGREAVALGSKLALLGAGGGFAFYRIARSAVDAGDELAEIAQRVGLSVDAFSQLRFAAEQADVSQEDFNSALDQFNKRLGEAKAGGGPMLEFLNKVSPALAAQVKGAKGTEEAFDLMTRAFEKVKDPGKRAALSAAVFGKSSLQMGQFLGQGSKAIGEQRKRFLELAGSQEEFAKRASDVDNAMRETETAFLGVRNSIFTALAPGLTELARRISNLIRDNRGGIVAWAEKLGKAFEGWLQGGGLERLTTSVGNLANTLGGIVDKVGGPTGLAAILAGIFSANMIASVVSLTREVGGLAIELGKAAAKATILARNSGVGAGAAGGIAKGAAALGLAGGASVAAAAGGVAAAGYQAYQHRQGIGELFTTKWGAPGSLKATIDEMQGNGWAGRLLGPLQLLNPVTAFGSSSSRTLGDTGAARSRAGGGEAHVTVDFNNAPKGTRVERDPSGIPVDLMVGYSMAGP